MKHRMETLRPAVFVAVFTLIGGCASTPDEPTMADTMLEHSDEVQRQSDAKKQLAEDWERGAKRVENGEKLLARGKKRVEEAEQALQRGQSEIERGTEQIAEGEEIKARSERRFRERFPDLSLELDDPED